MQNTYRGLTRIIDCRRVINCQARMLLFTTLLLCPLYSMATPASELTILTWQDYIAPDLVTTFEQEFSAKINFIYFESDDGREEILTTYGPSGYDLILVDSVTVPFYYKLNWIQALDISKAPNLRYVALPELAGLGQRDDNGLCTPYFWGTTGIAYRKDLVHQPIFSLKQLFEPSKELHGKVLMPTVANELVGMALKYLGYSMSSNDSTELEQARQVLLRQAPMITGYSAIAGDPETSKLVAGEVSVLITYSGDALMLKEQEPEIEYVLPEEGGAIWADELCISNQTNNTKLAYQFLDFINRPEQAAKNALYVYGASPNREATKLLPDEFLHNPVIYPDEKILRKSELYQPLSPSAVKKQNSILNELKRLYEQRKCCSVAG